MSVDHIIYELSPEDYSIIFQKFLREVFSDKIAEQLIADYTYKSIAEISQDSPKDKAINTLFKEYLSKRYILVEKSINILIEKFINSWRNEIVLAYTKFYYYVYTKENIEKKDIYIARKPSKTKMKNADYFLVNRNDKSKVRYETKETLNYNNKDLIIFVDHILLDTPFERKEYLKFYFESEQAIININKLKADRNKLISKFINAMKE